MKNPFCHKMPLAFCLLVLSAESHGGEQEIYCPSEIAPQSIRVVNVAQWTPFIQFPLHLSSAGMSSGPPEELAVLRGELLSNNGQGQTTRFEFGEDGFDHGKWLNCGYGAGSKITLSKRLSDKLKECTITYLDSDNTGKVAVKIVCR